MLDPGISRNLFSRSNITTTRTFIHVQVHGGSYKLMSTQFSKLTNIELQCVFFICGLCYTVGVYSQTLTLTPATVTVVENESVTLTCTYNGGTTEIITWESSARPNINPLMGGPDCMTSGFLINTNEYGWSCGENVFTLTFKRVGQNQENENWKCHVGINNSNEATIHVQVPVGTLSMSHTVQGPLRLLEHNEVEFVCVTSGERPASTITWYKDTGTNPDQEITVNISSSTIPVNTLTKSLSKLKLFPSRSDTGMSIYCSVYNIPERTPFWLSRQLDVLYPPTIGAITNKNYPEGSYVSLPCPYTPGNPSTTVFRWTRDGDSREWSVQALTITHVTQYDAMSYTCTIHNTMRPSYGLVQEPHSSVSFHLKVLFKTSILNFYVPGFEGQDTVTVDETTDVTFVCNVTSYPVSSVSVLFRTDVIQTDIQTTTLTHNRRAVTCLDAGIYTCNGSNTYNYGHPSTADLKLYVNCRPHLVGAVSENVTSAQNIPAALSVTTLAYPVPEQTAFKWQKFNGCTWTLLTNSAFVQISSAILQSETTFTDVTQSNLTFNSVKQSDFGRYRLLIEHALGNYTQPFLLQLQDTPEPPTSFHYILESVTGTSAVIQWTPGFDGGHPQTFIVQYRGKSTSIWSEIAVKDRNTNTMNATLTQLNPGVWYLLQMYSTNSEGNSSTTYAIAFVPTDISEIEPTSSTSVAVIASLSVALVTMVFVVVVLAVVIIILRRTQQKEKLSTDQSGRTEYNNVQLPVGPESRNEHEHVQGDNLQNISTYESLQKDNEVPSTYSSITAVAEMERPVDNKKTYENLSLSNMSQ